MKFFFINILLLLITASCTSDSQDHRILPAYRVNLTATDSVLPANGLARTIITAKIISPTVVSSETVAQFYIKDGVTSIQFLSDPKCQIIDNTVSIGIRAALVPGTTPIGLLLDKQPMAECTLTTQPDWTDTDHDGFPNVTELTSAQDKRHFIDSFVAIADAQFYQLSDAWHEDQRDCAGLIRFAYREALKQHSDDWHTAVGWLHAQPAPDVEKFSYPNIPLIGTRLFRMNNLSVADHDVDSLFSAFVEAKYLLNYNCVSVGKNRTAAQTGDLVFFFHFNDPTMPYHSMIFIKDPTDAKQDYFIYHTGPSEEETGEVRKLRREIFNHHPDERWRPEPNNPFFLGYYRWKIIN